MHRELPVAERADITPDRYHPRKTAIGMRSLAQFYTNELNARVEPCGTDVLTPKDCTSFVVGFFYLRLF